MKFLLHLAVVIPLCWAVATVFACILFRALGRYNSRH